MTWGPQLDFLKGLKEEGLDPPALRDRPLLDERLSFYNDIFNEISESRTYSAAGTPLPLPVSEINSYFEMYYIDSLAEREIIHKMVRALDRAYVKLLSERAEEERDAARDKHKTAK